MTSNEEPKPDQLHTFGRQVLEAKYREQRQHNADLRDELRQLGAQNESLHAALMEASDKLAAYEAGTDPTPPAEGAVITAEQLWHKLLNDAPEGRLAFLMSAIENTRSASFCFQQDHQGRIDALTYDLTDVQVRLERALRLEGPRPLTGLVTAVEALRSVMVDGIAQRSQVLSTEVEEVELEDIRIDDFPLERDTVAKIGEQLKSAGIDTRGLCRYEWKTEDADPYVCTEHDCGETNPLHVGVHRCGNCGSELSHVEAEKLAEAGR